MNRSEFDVLTRRIASDPLLAADNGSPIDALVIGAGGSHFRHVFTPQGDELHAMRSLSKVVLGLCIGIAIDSGRYSVDGRPFGLDSRIWPTLRQRVSVVNRRDIARLEQLTVWHLLTQTVGYANSDLMCSTWLIDRDYGSLLDVLLNEPIEFEPGARFVYSNASAFILSAFFQEMAKETVYEIAQRQLFEPLDILEHTWTSYGRFCAGATGLYLRVDDLHKIGSMLLQRGTWNNKQIVSASFVTAMSRKHTDVHEDRWREGALSPTGYGLLVWINKDGYYATGANGQYLIVQPRKDAVVSVISSDRLSGALLGDILAAL